MHNLMSSSKGPNTFTSCNNNTHLDSGSLNCQLLPVEVLPMAFLRFYEISLIILKTAPAPKLEGLCPSLYEIPLASIL